MANTPKQKPKRISQDQMAKDLGVSQALISMVLNGREHGIAKESVKRIWDYATKHGYKPRGMQIFLNRQKQIPKLKNVGYVLRSPLKLTSNSTFFSHVSQGLYDAFLEDGTKTLFLGGENDLSMEDPDRLSQSCHGLKGIVILGEVAKELVLRLTSFKIPIVSISASYNGLCHSILSNETQAAAHLIDHLYALGHREFAWIEGNQKLARCEMRRNATETALLRHKLSLHSTNILSTVEADRQDGYNGIKNIFEKKSGPKPTALVCYNGLIARGAIDYMVEHRMRAGKDFSVVAFDSTRVCQESNPTITASSSIPEEMGRAAAHLILDKDNHSSQENAFCDLTLPATLKIRESSGSVPATKSKSLR